MQPLVSYSSATSNMSSVPFTHKSHDEENAATINSAISWGWETFFNNNISSPLSMYVSGLVSWRPNELFHPQVDKGSYHLCQDHMELFFLRVYNHPLKQTFRAAIQYA